MLANRGVQPQPWLEKWTNPPNVDPITARTETPVSQRQVSDSKNQHRWVKWRVCFSKTRATRTRPELYKKSGQIRQNQAISDEILTRLGKISTKVVGFSQIWPNPSNFYWKKKMQIPKKKMHILVTFLQILTTNRNEQRSPSPKTNSID